MTDAEAAQLVKEFERDELKAILHFAYSNFSGGVTLEDADAHFEAGCDHLIKLRPSLVAIITRKFKD